MRANHRVLIGLFVSILLLIGGAATTVGASVQRATAIRGWADPAHTTPLPSRAPLAGVNVELTQYSAETLDEELKQIASVGFTWIRQFFYWQDIEAVEDTFDFSKYDVTVNAVAKQPSLRFVAVLHGSPLWARRSEASDRITAPPASMAAFGKFAAEFAKRYGDKIDFYQIWDEPNLNTQWGGLDPRPADYAALLKTAYTAIKGNDSTATVIAAALAPTVETGPRNLSDVLFLQSLYDVGAANSFDAAAGKPYGFNFSPDDRTVNPDVLNFSHIILLREEMLRRGDGHKPLWGSNFGWNSLPDGWTGTPSIWGQINAETQKHYTRDAYARAMREWAWLGGLILYHWQPAAPADDPVQGFAVRDKVQGWFSSDEFFKQTTLSTGLYAPTDPHFTYAGDWRFGELGADVQAPQNGESLPDGSQHTLRFSFEGDSLALLLRRADYVAYIYARIDGQPANALPQSVDGKDGYIMLKSPDLQNRTDLVTVADHLAPGEHTAELRFYLGYERWALAGVAVGSVPDTRQFDLLIAFSILAALIGFVCTLITGRAVIPRVVPNAIGNSLGYIQQAREVIAGLAMSLLALVGMLLTWNGALPEIVRRDTPSFMLTAITAGLVYFSPHVIFTIVVVIVLWLLIYNRPPVGLALVIFWAPFFLAPVQLYIWALPMVELCLLLTLSAVIIKTLIAHQLSFSLRKFNVMDWAVLAFVAVATVSLLWSEQRSPAIRAWRIMVIEPALYYALLRTTRLTRDELIRLVDVLLLAGVLIAGMGLINYFTGGSGVTITEEGARRLAGVYGSYASPNNLALFLGRCIPFALAMVLIAPNTLRRLVAGLIALLTGIAILLTQSGGALLLGVPAGVICVLVLWGRRGRLLAGVLIATMLLMIPLSRFVPRLQNVLNLTRSSSFARTQVWSSAVSLLRERPLTGAGLDQFLYLYRSRFILPDAWREPDLNHPHNIVLDFWVSLGIAGLVVLLILQVTFWRSALKGWHRLQTNDLLLGSIAIGAMGSMADVLAHGLVDNSYFVVDLAFIFCFLLGIVNRLSTLSIAENEVQG